MLKNCTVTFVPLKTKIFLFLFFFKNKTTFCTFRSLTLNAVFSFGAGVGFHRIISDRAKGMLPLQDDGYVTVDRAKGMLPLQDDGYVTVDRSKGMLQLQVDGYVTVDREKGMLLLTGRRVCYC